jgi:hypothetical protein
MDTLNLSSLIGKEIADLRFHYVPENEYGLQSFHSFLKLTDGTIVDIPKFDDNIYLHLTKENLDYFNSMFESGETCDEKIKALIVGQKITDLYFCYYNNEIDVDYSAFIKLTNNMYFSEKNFGPVGVTDVDLMIFNEEQFNAEKHRLQSFDVVIKKFKY